MNILPLLRTLLFAALLLAGYPVHSAEKPSPPKPGNLWELSQKLPPVGSRFKLSPEWVGTVRRVHLRGGAAIYKDDRPTDLRLTHAWVGVSVFQKDGPPFLEATRGSEASESPVFYPKLPSAMEVETMTLKEMRKSFGPQKGGTTGSGGTDGSMHWTEGWTCFTFESPTELRFLHVFAHVHGDGKADDAAIDILQIREGVLKPANPVDMFERAKFKTGDDLAAEAEKQRMAKLAKFPEPLRSLLEATSRQDDSDLALYKKALEAVRAKPDKKLIAQMVAELGRGRTPRIQELFNVLFDVDIIHQDLAKWKKPQQALARKFLCEALSAATTPDAFETALVALLTSMGGGSIKLEVEEVGEVDLTVPPEGEGGYSSASSGIEVENLKTVITATQKYLLEEYPELAAKK